MTDNQDPRHVSELLGEWAANIRPPAWPCPTCHAKPGQPCVTVTGVPMPLNHGLRNRPKRRRKRKRL